MFATKSTVCGNKGQICAIAATSTMAGLSVGYLPPQNNRSAFGGMNGGARSVNGDRFGMQPDAPGFIRNEMGFIPETMGCFTVRKGTHAGTRGICPKPGGTHTATNGIHPEGGGIHTQTAGNNTEGASMNPGGFDMRALSGGSVAGGAGRRAAGEVGGDFNSRSACSSARETASAALCLPGKASGCRAGLCRQTGKTGFKTGKCPCRF